MRALLLMLPVVAVAQPIEITPDTACGAPGVGKVWSGERRGQIEARERPGNRVTKEGWWARCTMPPPPRDCPEQAVEAWRGNDGWRLCTPAKHSVLRAQNVGREWSVYTPAGSSPWGSQRWRCEATGWVLIKSRCTGG